MSGSFTNITDSNYKSLCIKVYHFSFCQLKPPSNGSDLDSTGHQCEKQLPQSKEVFICGDFNCNMPNKYALSSKINDLCSSPHFSAFVF